RGVAGPRGPGADVVPRGIPGRGEHLHGEPRTAAGVAVRDHLGACRLADELAHGRLVSGAEQKGDGDVFRSGDTAGPRVARRRQLPCELLGTPHVEQDEPRLAEPAGELVEGDVRHAASDGTSSTYAAASRR